MDNLPLDVEFHPDPSNTPKSKKTADQPHNFTILLSIAALVVSIAGFYTSWQGYRINQQGFRADVKITRMKVFMPPLPSTLQQIPDTDIGDEIKGHAPGVEVTITNFGKDRAENVQLIEQADIHGAQFGISMMRLVKVQDLASTQTQPVYFLLDLVTDQLIDGFKLYGSIDYVDKSSHPKHSEPWCYQTKGKIESEMELTPCSSDPTFGLPRAK